MTAKCSTGWRTSSGTTDRRSKANDCLSFFFLCPLPLIPHKVHYYIIYIIWRLSERNSGRKKKITASQVILNKDREIRYYKGLFPRVTMILNRVYRWSLLLYACFFVFAYVCIYIERRSESDVLEAAEGKTRSRVRRRWEPLGDSVGVTRR